MLLLPDKGVGLFAFSSKTYGGASLPTLRAALALQKAGFLTDRKVPLSAGLASAYDAARAVWAKGDIERRAARQQYADGPRFRAMEDELAGLKAEVGECRVDEPIAPVSAMEGRFDWRCAHGRINGRVQRAPTNAVTLQALEFNIGAP